jgi:hypothetical protein
MVIMRTLIVCAALSVASLSVFAQTQQPVPQPFPRPGQPVPPQPGQPPPTPAPAPAPTPAPTPAPPVKALPEEPAPTEATLGVPIYPSSQFLASYDAGRNQRYFLFGTTAPFNEMVSYYRNVLKQRGEIVFEEPPTHIFEVGRYREETMAFPPSVTIKDYTWGGSGGYLNPKYGAEPARFPTVIQIVPVQGREER